MRFPDMPDIFYITTGEKPRGLGKALTRFIQDSVSLKPSKMSINP
jgi:hypothetical protein